MEITSYYILILYLNLFSQINPGLTWLVIISITAEFVLRDIKKNKKSNVQVV